jgi:hypothetical protein
MKLWGLDLPQVNVLWQMEKSPISDISSAPVTTTTGDDSFLVILSGDVMFEFNKSDLRPGTDQILERAAKTIQSKIGPRFKDVVINGHTDSVGKDGYNQQLSEDRAKKRSLTGSSRAVISRLLRGSRGASPRRDPPRRTRPPAAGPKTEGSRSFSRTTKAGFGARVSQTKTFPVVLRSIGVRAASWGRRRLVRLVGVPR